MAAVTFKVQVDWDNSGTWVDLTDTQPVLNAGVSVRGGRQSPRQFAPLVGGVADWRADNRDLRFSDPSGTIGTDLKQGRPMRIIAEDGTSTWEMFYGWLSKRKISIPQYPLIVADFAAVDLLGRYARTILHTEVFTNITTGSAIDQVIAAAGVPVTPITDTGLTTLAYWWADGISALEAINQLCQLEQGWAYVFPDGTIRFYDRHTRLDEPVTATWSEGSHVKAVDFVEDDRDIINRVTVKCPIYEAAGSPSVIWSLGDDLILAPGETTTINITTDDPFVGALCAVGTDYFYTGGGAPSVSVYQLTGKETRLLIGGGTGGNVISSLQVRAQPVTKSRTVEWFEEDTDSQDEYGIKDYSLELPYLSDPNVGRDFCQAILGRYKNPRPAVAVTLKAGTRDSADAVLLQQLNALYGNKITLSLPFIGVTWSGFVEGITHKVKAEMLESTFLVEQAATEDMLTLDDTTYGLLDNNSVGW